MVNYRLAFRFCSTAIIESMQGRQVNIRLSLALVKELARRSAKLSSRDASAEDWKIFKKKLLRFRPRLVDAVSAYSLISGVSYRELRHQGGLGLFRMMWFLGSAQDDLIDEILPQTEQSTTDELIKKVRGSIFGADRLFYQAAFAVFVDELKRSDFPKEAKAYLQRKIRDWYSFLVRQEARVLSARIEEFTFAYCRAYREEQNRMIGALLTACLNGRYCAISKMQHLELVIPALSLRTQIVDDISDIPEDLNMGRPSYCVGALVDCPDELTHVRAYLAEHCQVRKLQPREFKKIAPKSYALVVEIYRQYGENLYGQGQSMVFLRKVGDLLFDWFPMIKNILYKIYPPAANF